MMNEWLDLLHNIESDNIHIIPDELRMISTHLFNRILFKYIREGNIRKTWILSVKCPFSGHPNWVALMWLWIVHVCYKIQFVPQAQDSPPESFYRPVLEHQTWEEARVIDTPAYHGYGRSTGCQRRTLSQHAFWVSDLASEDIVYVLAKRDL